jgi:hypothetical protein
MQKQGIGDYRLPVIGGYPRPEIERKSHGQWSRTGRSGAQDCSRQ